MEIAIPSFKRSATLKRKTLAFLESEGFPKESITIFVADSNELFTYKEELGDSYKIVVGFPGISNQRTFIRNYYPEGTKILSLDDDIRKIKFMRDNLTLKTLSEKLFALLEKENLTTWGLYPVNNLFFCKDRVLIGSLYIIGCCYGFINKKDFIIYPEETSGKEDCWYSLKRVELDGAVLRYEGCCPDTDYYASGGLAESRTLASEEKAAQKVCSLFPDETKFAVKKNGHAEVKIKRKILKNFLLE
jgi:hypothetical protein